MYSMLLMMAAGPVGEAPAFHGCRGCHGGAWVAPAGCCGGCCGGWGYGHGAYRPASTGSYAARPAYYGCCGGGCWGASYGCCGGYGAGQTVIFTPAGSTNLNPPDGTEKAAIRIDLPSNAKLSIDGREVTGTGPVRSFATPALPRGQDFFYDVKAEITVDGKPVVEEKRVIVRAGGTVSESFGKLLAAVPATGDKVAGK